LCQNEQQNVNVNPDNLTVIIHGSKRQILTRLVKNENTVTEQDICIQCLKMF